MTENALRYVIEAIQERLKGKEFKDMQDGDNGHHYEFIGIHHLSPVQFSFVDKSCRIILRNYYAAELENLREVELSLLEQTVQNPPNPQSSQPLSSSNQDAGVLLNNQEIRTGLPPIPPLKRG